MVTNIIRGVHMSHKEMGIRIKQMRGINNMTREELAEKAEISSKFLYEIELGKKGLSADTLLKIAKTLSCSCDYIMTGEELPKGKSSKALQLLSGYDEKDLKRVTKILSLVKEIHNDKR